jgi:HemY protein
VATLCSSATERLLGLAKTATAPSKTTPTVTPLLSALGHLYYQQQQYVLAQGYLERSVALQPTAADQRALAGIMEHQRLFEKAAEYYRLSLS